MALTVSISVERYLNCCHPNDKFVIKSTLVPAPILFTVLYNIPKFFEITSCTVHDLTHGNLTNNVSSPNIIPYQENITESNIVIDELNVTSIISKTSTAFPSKIHANFSNDVDDVFNELRHTTERDQTYEHDIDYDYDTDSCLDGYRTTRLRSNWWYIVLYTCWSKFVLIECVPWIIVIILTVCTTRTLKNFQVNRDRLMGVNRTQQANNEGEKNE